MLIILIIIIYVQGSREHTPSVAWIREYYYICTAYKAIIFKPFSTEISNLCNKHICTVLLVMGCTNSGQLLLLFRAALLAEWGSRTYRLPAGPPALACQQCVEEGIHA